MKKGEKTVTLPFSDHEKLVKFRNTIEKDGAFTVAWIGGGGFGGLYSPSYKSVEYFTKDEAILKLGELNDTLREELTRLDELHVKIRTLEKTNSGLEIQIYNLEKLNFWDKLIGAFKNRKQ